MINFACQWWAVQGSMGQNEINECRIVVYFDS